LSFFLFFPLTNPPREGCPGVISRLLTWGFGGFVACPFSTELLRSSHSEFDFLKSVLAPPLRRDPGIFISFELPPSAIPREVFFKPGTSWSVPPPQHPPSSPICFKILESSFSFAFLPLPLYFGTFRDPLFFISPPLVFRTSFVSFFLVPMFSLPSTPHGWFFIFLKFL